jgi:aspartyl-tRNA(Asn)/glutamyl-tRNA(Gln) amidotransferase subunit C
MSVNREDVLKIAHLARLELSEDEVTKYTEQLNSILNYMEKLNELDTDKVEPMSHPHDIRNVLRADELKPSLPRGEAMRNAPKRSDIYFKVPKVLKHG